MVLHSSMVELFEGKIDLADMRPIEGTMKKPQSHFEDATFFHGARTK